MATREDSFSTVVLAPEPKQKKHNPWFETCEQPRQTASVPEPLDNALSILFGFVK